MNLVKGKSIRSISTWICLVYLTCQYYNRSCVHGLTYITADIGLGSELLPSILDDFLLAWLSTSLLDCGQLRHQTAFPSGWTRTVYSLQAHTQQRTCLDQGDNSFSSSVSLPTPWMSRLKDLRQPSVRTYCRSCECAGPLGDRRYTTVITLLHICPSRRFLLIIGTMCFINCGYVVDRSQHTLLQSREKSGLQLT